MKSFFKKFDINKNRFNPKWLIVGAIIGRYIGLLGGLDIGMWALADSAALIGWQILGAVIGALFFSFLMTSKSPFQTKGALLGLGIGMTAGIISAEFQTAISGKGGLQNMPVDMGIWYDWLIMHLGWIGCISGWIIGAVLWKKKVRLENLDKQVKNAEEGILDETFNTVG